MATTVQVKLDLSVKGTEVVGGVGAGDRDQVHNHIARVLATYANGTGASQQDLIYSQTLTANGATDYDLTALTHEGSGATVNMANVSGFIVINHSTTSAETVTIGAGSNPWITWLNATGDAVVIGPGGAHVWTSPVDAAAVTASTGDILRLTTSASLSFTLIIWGQSA